MKKHLLFKTKAGAFEKYHAPVNFRNTWQIFRIMSEFVEGYQLLGQFQKTVTIFGSARAEEDSFAYQAARRTAYLLGKDGFAVITGGGPGVMEAGNRGATEADAESVGLTIELPEEQIVNSYVKKSAGFNYFFIRKVMLTSPSQAAIFFPGGLGTLDEFFEIADLIEIGKIKKIPLILVGRDFWEPMVDFLKECSCQMVGALKTIDFSVFQVVNTAEEAIKIIRSSKVKKVLRDPSREDFGEAFNWRLFRIMSELVGGFEFLSRDVRNDITILGTKSVARENPYYQAAEKLARRLGEKKYMIITGGGPGIMEAANKGAFDSGAASIGFNMKFNGETRVNPYVNKSLGFYFPFTRKLILTLPSLAFVFFPGGFGTMHQFFEVLTLMKTNKMRKEMVVILYGKKFWQPLDRYIRETLLEKYGTIAPEYCRLYRIVDSVEEAEELIPPKAH